MQRAAIHRLVGVVPVILSFAAFSLVLVVVATGLERGLKDEGAAAHLFQLLVVAQAPFIVAFFYTANWSRIVPIAKGAGLQAAALVVALSSVAYFKL